MTLRTDLILAAVVTAFLAFAVYEWKSEHDARLKAEVTVEAQKAAISANQQQITALDSSIKATQQQLVQVQQQQTQQLAELSKQWAAIKTPQQIAAQADKVMQLPQPIIVNPATNTATVPFPDAPAAKAYLESCETCKLNLGAATKTADAQSRIIEQQKAQLDAEKQNSAAIAKERDTWEQTAKGGTFWTRVKHDLKIGLIGGGVALVAVCGSGHCR